MNNRWRVGCLVASMLALGIASAKAQAPMPASRTYECAPNAHCSVFCQIDAEKQMQTGAPKTVTVTPLAEEQLRRGPRRAERSRSNSLFGRRERSCAISTA